jgi:hypothetical protein
MIQDKYYAKIQKKHKKPYKLKKHPKNKSITSMDVYSLHLGGHFGDIWRSISYLCNLSIKHNWTTRITKYCRYYGKVQDTSKLIQDIYKLLDTPGKIEIIDARPTNTVKEENIFGDKLIPTKLQWKNPKNNTICYQFDGVVCAKRCPPESTINNLIKLLSPYYKFIKLGKPKTPEECLKIAINCKLFIGVDSGMSHLCLSAGVPIHLIRKSSRRAFNGWFKNRDYQLYNSITQLHEYLLKNRKII